MNWKTNHIRHETVQLLKLERRRHSHFPTDSVSTVWKQKLSITVQTPLQPTPFQLQFFFKLMIHTQTKYRLFCCSAALREPYQLTEHKLQQATSISRVLDQNGISRLHNMLSLTYPKILLSVLQTARVRIFRFLTAFYCGRTTNHQKQNSVKGHFFCYSSCKKSPWTHIFNHTEALQNRHTNTRTPLFCFHLLKSFLSKTAGLFSKSNAPCVQLLLMPTSLSWTVVVWSELVSLVSCILPLLRLCAAICHWQWFQTLHIWRWLTSVKL